MGMWYLVLTLVAAQRETPAYGAGQGIRKKGKPSLSSPSIGEAGTLAGEWIQNQIM